MSDIRNLTYDVTINQLGPLSEGFLDNEPYYLKVPFPTTLTNAITKAKALYRWNFMIFSISKNATIEKISNIVKIGANLHDNPPSSISFRIKFDRNFYFSSTEDNTGNFFELRLGSIDNPGTGYLPGQILTALGGTPSTFGGQAQFRILSTTQSGSIISLEQIDVGHYITVPTNPVPLTGGTGTGAQVDLSVISNPQLKGRMYLRRRIAEALMFSGSNILVEVYDPTPTPPHGPPPKPLIPRNPQRTVSVNFVPLASSISVAESNINITIV
ncbi:MAG: hypothetical protein NZZ41_04135 [Candidatus Dojkabacteria bacterium]|nr:hypothetical protein [Candidatus Dojkabacteria bacterium]